MGSFVAGLVTGCLLGVSGTLLLLLLGLSLSGQFSTLFKTNSLRGHVYAAAVLITVSGIAYLLKLDKESAMLLLLLAVLAVAKQGGLVYGLAASAMAAVLLSFLFMPPVGSLFIKGPDDRLALALFLLIAAVGSRLIGQQRKLPQ
jgi:K+-sensing histidine kinase KdpD